jgi:DNA invertase Pin-like site-specific DNA recombinase
MATLSYLWISNNEPNEYLRKMKIDTFCRKNGITEYKLYKDVGRDENRTQLRTLIEEANEGDTVIFEDRFRAFTTIEKTLKVYKTLRDKNVRFICLHPEFDSADSDTDNALLTMCKMQNSIEESRRKEEEIYGNTSLCKG